MRYLITVKDANGNVLVNDQGVEAESARAALTLAGQGSTPSYVPSGGYKALSPSDGYLEAWRTLSQEDLDARS